MNFNTPYSRDISFFLYLLTCTDKQELIELDQREDVVILNTDYIITSYHILLGVNRAYYNSACQKTKSKIMKKEIIHCLTGESKLENSLNMHDVKKDFNENGNYFILFINWNKDECEKVIKGIKGNVISPGNYARFVNEDKIVKCFNITDNEINSCENGIVGAVYNRINTKDLK